jgi:HAD superfamily hydrolase (TIGR01484 family)
MYRNYLLVFDLDGTLSFGEGPVSIEVVKHIQSLEKKGNRICIASGKDYRYLLGLVRGMGLIDSIIIAENGGVIVENDCKILMPKDENIDRLCDELETTFKNISFQANERTTSIITGNNQALIDSICEFTKHFLEPLGKYTTYRQKASIDVMPDFINKGEGLKIVQEKQGYNMQNTICIGDGENDRPLSTRTDKMIVVGNGLEDLTNIKRFKTTIEMLDYLTQLVDKNLLQDD